MRISSFLSLSRQYLLSFVLIASVTTLFFALRDALDATLIALLYLILWDAPAFWGLGPGIQRINYIPYVQYFFIEPYTHSHSSSHRWCLLWYFSSCSGHQSIGCACQRVLSGIARERESHTL